MDTFADVSGGEVIHCTTLVYFGSFLCLPKAFFCISQLYIIIFTQHLFRHVVELVFHFFLSVVAKHSLMVDVLFITNDSEVLKAMLPVKMPLNFF